MPSRFRLIGVVAALALAALPLRVDAQDQTPAEAQATADIAPPAFTPSYDDWGEHGLMQTPVARVGGDGDFAFTFSHVHPYDRYNIFVTPLPWLEGGFRYTSINNRPYGVMDTNESYKDKSIDLKLLLARESAHFPELALGFRDMGGTGLFSGEYLVATRRIYDFDVSAGMGWGYLANRATFPNPFGVLGSQFKVRSGSAGAGALGFSFFRGPNVGLFGGVEYHTPIEGVRVKLEWDPNTYDNEPLGNHFQSRAPVNAGVVYDPYSFLELSAGVERGDTAMLRITVKTNFSSLGLFHDTSKPPALVPRPIPPQDIGRPLDETSLPQVETPSAESAPPAQHLETASTAQPMPASRATRAPSDLDGLYAEARRLGWNLDDVAIDGDRAQLSLSPLPGAKQGDTATLTRLASAALPGVTAATVTGVSPEAGPSDPAALEAATAGKVFAALKKAGFHGETFSMAKNHAWLSLTQTKYHIVTIALGRAARIVAANVPDTVELITVDLLEDNLEAASVTIDRRDLENAVADRGSPEEIFAHATFDDRDRGRPPAIANDAAYPYFDWSLNPRMRQQVGGGNSFFVYQIYAELAATAHLLPGISTTGVLGANLFNNLNALHSAPDSALPHVRSDIVSYLQQGKTGVFQMQGDYLFNIAPDWYGRVSGGLLEYMYGGVDGEVLWRPYRSRFAIGLDVNHVVKRDFDELFGFQQYQVTEGLVSFYYKLPFYNLTAALKVGRYLAGDKGATIDISRQFDSGIKIGVFATKTNVSASQFGEGSFDKGFYISFPLDLLLANPSRSVASYVYRPLTRDGGQYVDISKPLYQETDGYDPDALSAMWPQLLK